MKRETLVAGLVCLSLFAAVPASAVEPTEVAEAVAEAQDALITDRPDFTESTQTIPRGRMQLEGGATVTKRGSARETGIGELLLRVATGKQSELRLGANSYVVQRAPGSRSAGKDDVSLGLKVSLRETETTSLLAPRVSVIVQTSVPSGARALREDKWQPGAKLLFGWDVNEKTGFAANLNYDYASEDGQRFGQVSASASVGYAVSERTGAFLETYAFFPGSAGGENETFVDTGLTYLLNPDFQLDARVGVGIGNNVGSDYFFGVGAARRF